MPFNLRISFKKWKLHIKESIYFTINAAFNKIYIFIPIFFMGLWNTPEDLGLFSAPHRLAIVVTQGAALLTTGLYPTLSSLYIKDKNAYKKIFLNFQKLIIILAMPICIIATVFSREIITLLFGSGYTNSVGVFNVLIWFSFLMILRSTYGHGLLSAGFHRFNTIATGSGMFVIILLSIFLIHKYSGYGAAFALIIGEISTLILMAGLFRTKVQIHSDLFKNYLQKKV
jgi:O-antigen/teichoic acid export membrane protein